MICLVDMEHRQAVRQGAPCPDSASQSLQGPALHRAFCDDIRRRIERISNQECVVRRYHDVTQAWLDGAGVRALILSGNVTDWDLYDERRLQPLREIVRDGSLPVLGLCGGLQFIAMAHGAAVGPIRELERGELDPDDTYASGYFKEWGFTPLRVVRSDPLFDGLESPVFLEAHYWEVKSVPAGFELLASTDACRVQALRRGGTLVYGTQFHPEAYITKPSHRDNCLVKLVYPTGYPRTQPDGRRCLANFFRAVADCRR